jgi:hypothetical protein
MGSIRRRGRRVRVVFDEGEAALLLSLTSQVLDLLSDGEPSADAETDADADADADSAELDETDELEKLLDTSVGPVETPRDPVLLRLLPDGYRNDDDAAGEFRRLTESSLRSIKRAALQRFADDLSAAESTDEEGSVRIDLDGDAAEAWLPAITDVRLMFGTRIGVTEEMDDERATVAQGSLRYAEIAAYDWLSWVQDAIVRALMRE